MERAQLEAIVLATGVADQRGEFCFLADPQVAAGQHAEIIKQQRAIGPEGAGWLCIATGGTSGTLKFARHDEQTLGAAASGFCAHFGIERVNAIDVLPPHHVSGLMARVRCEATGGEHIEWRWSRLLDGERPGLKPNADWMISLVPTQLQRLLGSTAAVDWLRRFSLILIGGGPTWPQLADEAANAGLRVALSYGMTETAAMITALRPDEFLAGARSSGAALPHAKVSIDADGRVRVAGGSVFRGYYPDFSEAREFTTEDLGRIDARGYLHVLGRRDAVIITGGEKVQVADVEAALRASGEFVDVVVIGLPDPEWGEIVVACYPGDPKSGRPPDPLRAVEKLARHERPKRFVPIADWPRNAQGKVNRAALRARVTPSRQQHR